MGECFDYILVVKINVKIQTRDRERVRERMKRKQGSIVSKH